MPWPKKPGLQAITQRGGGKRGEQGRGAATCTPERTALLAVRGASPIVAVAIAVLAGDAILLENILRALGTEASAVFGQVAVILAGPAEHTSSFHLHRKGDVSTASMLLHPQIHRSSTLVFKTPPSTQQIQTRLLVPLWHKDIYYWPSYGTGQTPVRPLTGSSPS